MTRLAGAIGKLVLALVGMALLSAAALFVVGAFLTTYPILRLPPRERHLRAALDLAAAVAAAVAAFKDSPGFESPESEGPPSPAGPLQPKREVPQ